MIVLCVRRSKTTAWQPRFMQRFFYVYILVSEIDAGRHYTGITCDLTARLREHNRGHCPHSAKHKPWKIETAIALASETKARSFDRRCERYRSEQFVRVRRGIESA